MDTPPKKNVNKFVHITSGINDLIPRILSLSLEKRTSFLLKKNLRREVEMGKLYADCLEDEQMISARKAAARMLRAPVRKRNGKNRL